MSVSAKKATELIAKVEVLVERVNNSIETNTKAHVDMAKQISELCGRVNHQQEATDHRLDSLEKAWIKQESKYKGRMELFKWTSIGLGILVSILTGAKFLGFI